MNYKIAVLPGDGIGPEVVNQGIKVLKTIERLCNCKFELEFALVGGIAIDEKGIPLPNETLNF